MAEFLSTYVKELKNNDIVISSMSFDNLVSTDQLSDYLKNTGGTMTGTLTLLSGNYIQTNNVLCSLNYSYKNSFLQSEFVEDHPEWGIACTGSKGYCILQVCPNLSNYSDLSNYSANNAVRLSGNIDELSNNLDKRYSWAFGSSGNSQTLEIEAIDVENKIVVFKTELPSEIIKAKISSESQMIYAFDHDDNAIYCPKDPTIGNVVIHNFYGNHAEGGSTKAIGKYTHAEGRNAIADMRYSHAEGDSTFAGKMASHAEGQGSVANGHYSHAEGRKTYVDNSAQAAHAEGYMTSAYGAYSHAAGTYSNAADDCSWCWNGLSSTKYFSQGFGTFCINPVSGINGFYINDKSLSDILSSNSNIYIADEETLSLSGNKFSVKSNVFAEISCESKIKKKRKLGCARSSKWIFIH